MALFCAAIRRDSVSLLRFPFLSHVQVFSREILLISRSLLLLFTPWEFFTSVLADGFHWCLSDSKSPQVSWTLLSILAVLNNLVVWMVSTCPPTFKTFSLFNNPLSSVPKAPITVSIIITFMFHSFFNSLARSRYLYFFSLSFSFILWLVGTAKSTILRFSFFLSFFLFFFFLLIILRLGHLAEIRWSICKVKSQKSFTSCQFFTFSDVRVTTNPLRSQGLYSVLLPISAMM